MAFGGWDGALERRQLPDSATGGPMSPGLLPDGRAVLFQVAQGGVQVYDAARDAAPAVVPGLNSLLCVVQRQDGRCLLAVPPQGEVGGPWAPRLVDAMTGEPAGPELEMTPLPAFAHVVALVAGTRDYLAAATSGEQNGTATSSGSVRLWDLATGRLCDVSRDSGISAVAAIDTLTRHSATLLMVYGVPGRAVIWTVGADGSLDERRVVQTGPVQPRGNATLLPAPDGATWVVVTKERSAALFDVDSGASLGSLVDFPEVHIASVRRLPLQDEDGVLVALANGKFQTTGTVRLFDPVTRAQVGPALLESIVNPVVLTAAPLGDGRSALVARPFLPPARIWTPELPVRVAELVHAPAAVLGLATAQLPAGRRVLVSAHTDRLLRVWDDETGEAVGDPLAGHTQPVRAVAVVPTGPQDCVVATAGADRTVRRWDLCTHTALGPLMTGHAGTVRDVAAVRLPNGRTLILSASADRTVRRWDATSGTFIGPPLTGHEQAVTSVTAVTAPGGRVLVLAGGDDATIRRWDAETGVPSGPPLTGHTSTVSALTTVRLPDGRTLLVSGSDDGSVRFWDPFTGLQIGEPAVGHTSAVGAVTVVALRQGNAAVASGGSDGTVRLWNPATRTAIGRPLAHAGDPVQALAARPADQGSTRGLVSAGESGTLLLWTRFG